MNRTLLSLAALSLSLASACVGEGVVNPPRDDLGRDVGTDADVIVAPDVVTDVKVPTDTAVPPDAEVPIDADVIVAPDVAADVEVVADADVIVDVVTDAADDGASAVDGSEDVAPGLAAPTALVGTGGDGRALLRWAAVEGALRYALKRGTVAGGPYTRIGETVGTAFLDVAVTNGSTYFYVVSALDGRSESPDSNEVSVTPDAPPGPALALTAQGLDGRVELAWTRGPRAQRTRLRRTAVGTGAVVDLGAVAGASFTDTTARNGLRYRYTATSENEAGESAPTAPVEALPMAAPADLIAVAGDRRVDVSWTPTEGAAGYVLEAATGAAGAFAMLARSALPRFSDTGLTNGALRRYRVAAASDLGVGAVSAEVSATPSEGAVVPLRPENLALNQAGINTWFLRDWSGDAAFVDVFKQSRPWQDGTDWHNPVAGIDAHGWPTADASTVLFSGDPADFNGTYHLVFEGQATVSIMWAAGSVDNARYDAATNTTTADLTFRMTGNGSVGVVFRSTRRTPASPLNSGFANARLYRPGYPTDGSAVFTTAFVEATARGRVVRHMDWTNTNNNVVERWADRATPNDCTQADRPAPAYTADDGTVYNGGLGVAIEHQVQLCNVARTDCWFNVPPAADDTYVRNLALAIRYGTDGTNPYTAPQARPVYPPLDPDLRVYVEYANEIWHSSPGFYSFRVIQARCAHLPADHPLLSPTTTSVYTLMWRYPAWRITTIRDTFRDVFGEGAMLSRVRPVLMTQVGNAQATLSTALTWLDTWLRESPTPRSASDVLYGAGGSGYYGVNDGISARPDQFFATSNYPDVGSVRAFSIDTVWAANYGLRHVAYEGGPGLSYSAGDNRTLNADPRMQTLMEATHDAWSAAGGDLLVYYTLRGPSEWEFTPNIRSADTPKLRALARMQTLPRAPVALGPALPGVLIARDLASLNARTGYGYDTTVDGLAAVGGNRLGNMTVYTGHAAAPYSGMLRVTGLAGGLTRLGVFINGVRQGEVSLPATGTGGHLIDTAPLEVRVPAGVVAVRLEVLEGDLILRSISL